MHKIVDLRRTSRDAFHCSNYPVVFVDVADSFASGRTSTIKGDGLKFEIATVDRRGLTALHISNGDCVSEQPGSGLWSERSVAPGHKCSPNELNLPPYHLC